MKILTALMLSAGLLSPVFVHAATASAAPGAALQPGALAKGGSPVKVTAVEGITEYRLHNGMRVLLFPDASKPTLTTNIVYLVGSRHENYGETGMAHLLEHLLFKPTANFGIKKGTRSPVEVLNASGAEFNGTTANDRTNYFSVFPANEDNLRTMLELEADRMVNSPIDQNDLWSTKTNSGEMTVVRNEFEMGESDPLNVTTQRLQAAAFDWHNYGKSTIGARSDIEHVNVARLRAFYKNYYQPDNAVLMVAGRFDEAKVLRQVNAIFGKIPRPTRVLQPTYTVEPTQDGERAVTVRRSGGTQYVGAGYHVPASAHVDSAAMSLLTHILTDAPGGRLHKALVETRLATRLDSDSSTSPEQGYRIFGAVVPKELPLDVTQETMLKVLEGLKTQPVTEDEVTRARLALLKQVDLTMNDTASLTIGLTESLAAGDWRLFFLRRDQIEKLDAKAVQAAAEKYLKASNRTVGRFIPTDTPDRTEVPDNPDVARLVANYQGHPAIAQGEAFDPSPANVDARTERFTLPNGLKGALLPKKTKGGTVSVSLQLRTGSEAALRGQANAGMYAGALLTSGSEHYTRQQIKDNFDKLKAQLSINANATGITANITTVRENLPAAMALLAEVLQKPTYAPTEFAEFQRDQINRIEQGMPEPDQLASNAFERLIDSTPEGHVLHKSTLPQQLVEARAVKVEQVRAFHAAFYGADNATFAAVGDFDAPALKAQLASLFGGWKAAQPYVRIPQLVRNASGENIVLQAPDKASSMMLAVVPVPLKDDAATYPALLMANQMLGGGALRSRLADRIRQKDGLSYGIGSQLNVPARDASGFWLVYAMSAPENTQKVVTAMREEIARALKDGFTEAELVEAKKGWKQGEEVYRTMDAGLAGRLGYYLTLDRTMAHDKQLEAAVAALTVAQVNEAMRLYVKPEALSVVMAGDFAKSAASAGAKPATP